MSRKTSSILVQDVPVTIMSIDQRDYISLTDMAKARTDAGRAADVIKNWLRARSTLEFLGTWEIMYNPDFKVVEFDHFKSEAGLHTFTLSAKPLPSLQAEYSRFRFHRSIDCPFQSGNPQRRNDQAGHRQSRAL